MKLIPLLLAATAALPAAAAPLQRATVPADPLWVLHVDCDALRPTAIGQYLLAEMDKPEAQARFAVFQSVFSFDPRKQLHGVTLFTTGGKPDDPVLLLHADIDANRLVTLAQAANDSQSTPHGGYTIYNWIDDKKPAKNGVKPRVYAAIFGADTVLFGQKEASVGQALEVLAGTAPNLAQGAGFPQFGAGGNSHFIVGAARKLDLPPNDPNAAMFRLAKAITLQLGEAQGQVRGALRLEAGDEETAGRMAAVAQGLVALLKLQADANGSKLAEALAIKQDGASLNIQLQMPATQAVEIIKADAAKKAAKKAAEN